MRNAVVIEKVEVGIVPICPCAKPLPEQSTGRALSEEAIEVHVEGLRTETLAILDIDS